MNTTDTLGALNAKAEDLTARLTQAMEDVAILKRLADAEAAVPKLREELAATRDAIVIAFADKVEAERKARFAKFGSITVTADHSTLAPSNVLATAYTITYERLTYYCDLRGTVMAEHGIRGFEYLPAEVMEYLLVAKPDAIPAAIRALGDTPEDAMDRYLTGKRRGFLAN